MQKLQANSFLSLPQAALFLAAQAKRPGHSLQDTATTTKPVGAGVQQSLLAARARPYKVAGMSEAETEAEAVATATAKTKATATATSWLILRKLLKESYALVGSAQKCTTARRLKPEPVMSACLTAIGIACCLLP